MTEPTAPDPRPAIASLRAQLAAANDAIAWVRALCDAVVRRGVAAGYSELAMHEHGAVAVYNLRAALSETEPTR